MPPAGATIDSVGGYAGLTWFTDSVTAGADAPVDTVQLVDTLQSLMPRLGESRDAVAVDLMRCADLVIISLAGIEAEHLVIGDVMAGTAHDLEEATAIAGLLCRSPASVDAYLAFARTEAAALLAAHTAAAITIAYALVARRTLTVADIDNIIQRKAGR
jgi:hypothetical protein